MDALAYIWLGLEVILQGPVLAYLLAGCALGMLFAVLPGTGPVAGVALLLPWALALPPLHALIMLAGVYQGSQFGGSVSAILWGRSGNPASAVTASDGYALARRGRTKAALAVASIASFAGAVIGTGLLAAGVLPLLMVAYRFGPAEYACLMLLGILGVAVLSPGSLLKSVGLAVLGVLLGLTIATVPGLQEPGAVLTSDGRPLALIAIGLFVVGDLVARLSPPPPAPSRQVQASASRGLSGDLTRRDLQDAAPGAVRGIGLGAVLGLVPGGGAVLAAFSAHAVERRLAPGQRLGDMSALRGVAAPEGANSAAAQTALLPMMVLGVAPNVALAMVLGLLLVGGLPAGPAMVTQAPTLFWGLVAAMWASALMLLLLHVPLWRLWSRLAGTPYGWLAPLLLLVSCVGIWAMGPAGPHELPAAQEVLLLAGFGLAGCVLRMLRAEPGTLLLGFVLGPMMADHLRHALVLSGGQWTIFIQRPWSVGLLLVCALMLVVAMLPAVRSAGMRSTGTRSA